MTVTNDDFKPVTAGAMRGFCDVTLPSGMRLHRRTVFGKDGKGWVSPPSKQVIGRDGLVHRNAAGKPTYEPTGSFIDRATQDRWSDAVIEAPRAAHPEVLT